MTKDKREWRPADEETLKSLIRDTIKAIGPMDPDALPHKIRERIRARAAGDLDIDAYIREVLEEQKKRKR